MSTDKLKRNSLKLLWFCVIAAATGVIGTVVWVCLIALNFPEDEARMPQSQVAFITITSALALILLLAITIYILRKPKNTLLRWTSKSCAILVPAVIFISLIVVVSLSQTDDTVEIDPKGSNSQPEQVTANPLPTPAELLAYTNEERIKNNLNPLSLNTRLSESALLKCNDMVAKNYWAHEAPSGTKPWSFIDQTGYKYQEAAENLAYGFADTKSIINGWMNSEGHRVNILSDKYSEVGFGICRSDNYINQGKHTIVVQHFAMPAN